MEGVEKKISKKEANRILKKDAKEKKKEHLNEVVCVNGEDIDVSKHLYGLLPLNQSLTKEMIKYVSLSTINEEMAGQKVRMKGHMHHVRKTGKQVFVVLRDYSGSIQCIAYMDKIISKQMISFISSINKESFVDVKGTVATVEKAVESCTQTMVEIKIEEVFVISMAKMRLPMQIEDAMRPENSDDTLAKVNLDTRLDNRVLDLRTPCSRAIMEIQFKIETYFVDYLNALDFIRIRTPNLISAASEGGANVFEVTYFNEKAYMAQSPQLYKQMAICANFEKVYVVGPVFRAENSNTHRHLCEFTGLDLEMSFNSHYHEVVDVICQTMIHIFKELEKKCIKQIETVKRIFPVEPFEFVEPALVLNFSEAVDMLRDAGVEMGDFQDLSTTNEKFLGKLVKKKFATDFFVLDKFPLAVRPFYTMPDPKMPGYSNSYDMFMRGEEILSGAQRIHDYDMLCGSAKTHGINLDTIKDYLESFSYGCPPHAGGGIGLERVTMLYLGLDNIRRASLFCRDPKRLTP